MKHGNRLLIAGLGVAALAVALAMLTPLGQDPVAANGTIHYVDGDATTGGNNGSSWADAFTDLQPALDAAATGDEIWVAAGTYTPTAEHGGSGDRYRSFQMKNGVAIYGGFDPSVGDTAWADRDWEANLTILSGDLNGDDEPDFANNDENSYHVFYHPEEYTDLDSTAILDGFTVRGGNADGDEPHYVGGGMYNAASSPTLTNCSFEGNSALGGGGMYNHISSSPTLTNCSFEGNSAAGGGGGMYNAESTPALTDCTFSGNSAASGGGMANRLGSSPTLTNCTFEGNSAANGGGMHNIESSPTLTNCTFSGNSAGDYGGGMLNVDSSPTLTNCAFSGNSASTSGGGIYNASSSPVLTNCILWGNSPNQLPGGSPVVTYSDIQGGYEGEGNIDTYPWFVDPGNGDFHLGACSPCIDAGDNDASGLPPYDFEGDERILDGDDDGTATVDMGVDEVAVVGTCFRVYLPLVLRGY